jgi:HD-GYP domain-containing protein (c-di-GMP phosphodiesterase class II)
MELVLLALVALALVGLGLTALAARRERAALAAQRALAAEQRAAAEAELAETRRDASEAARHLGAARQEAEQAEARLQAERARRARAERGHRMEREWSRELRTQVADLHRRMGTLGSGDVRDLVLRLAMQLLQAQKGLFLERQDADGDGRLDLAGSLGFTHDPEGSNLAQRLAFRVLREDETLREQDATALAEGGTAADAEIENLVAIPVYMADQLSGVVVCCNRPGGFDDLEDEVLLALGDHAGAVLHNGRLRGQLRGAYLGTVSVLADAIEAKDPSLRGHSEEVANLVGRVAGRLGVPEDEREALVFASLLHDVGKLAIPEHILRKPGPLTEAERAAIRQHPSIGYRMLKRVPALRAIAPAVLYHHEHVDGTGYPTGLRGDDIPIGARIIGVVDAYAAMVGERPYGTAIPKERAVSELVAASGTHFDPVVVAAVVEELDAGPPLDLPRALPPEGSPAAAGPEPAGA